MKTCKGCGDDKAAGDYYAQPAARDGLMGKCKECHKAGVRRHRAANLERIRAYDRERGKLPHRRAHVEDTVARWRKSHPLAVRAHNMVARNIGKGNLVAEPCEVCRAEKVVAHHDDYANPLNVRWLCQSHHKQWHRDNGPGLNRDGETT